MIRYLWRRKNVKMTYGCIFRLPGNEHVFKMFPPRLVQSVDDETALVLVQQLQYHVIVVFFPGTTGPKTKR